MTLPAGSRRKLSSVQWLRRRVARLIIENAKEIKCLAETINEFVHPDSPRLWEDVAKLLVRGKFKDSKIPDLSLGQS